MPVTVGVYDTEQVAIFGAFPAASVQVADAGLKVPALLVVKVTVPVGTVGLVELSVTFAVQVVGALTKTDPCEQLTRVFVEWSDGGTVELTARLKLPVLPEWVGSPL